MISVKNSRGGIIDIRTMDTTTNTISIKSWLFQDQFVKPEDFVLYRKRADGGLGLIHPKVKAQALSIKCFLETVVGEQFVKRKYYEAIFKWYILKDRNLTTPVSQQGNPEPHWSGFKRWIPKY